MPEMMIVAFLLAGGAVVDQPVAANAHDIMARVAANQDREAAERESWIYTQRIRIETRRPHGQLIRREIATYTVTPAAKSSTKTLSSLEGCRWHAGKWVEFHGQPVALPDTIDADLIQDFRNDFINDKSKDGIGSGLFPLTTDDQKKLRFELIGEQNLHGRKVWRIRFRPVNTSDFGWSGEALIDQQDVQPVNAYTTLSRRIPFAVRTLLGTDVPGLGFNLTYSRVADGVWFPTSFGTEFKLRAVFFLNRQINISMESTGFRRAAVDSKIDYDQQAKQP